MNSAPPIKQWFNLVLVGGFALALSLPTIYWACHFKKGKAIDEYRPLAAFPILSAESVLQDYGKNLEKYYDDHFGCRELFIAFDLMAKRALSSTDTAPNVLAGNDGWLYYSGDNMVNNYLGISKLSLRRLKIWQVTLEERRDWLAARGIKYLFIMVPNKESIYPDYLPGWLKQAPTKSDQFVAYMRVHSTVEILDLRPALRAARGRDSLFYKTDTHWNLMGGFVAYGAVMSKLSNEIPELAPIDREDFEIQRASAAGGDLARSAGEPDIIDGNVYTFTPKSQLPELEFYDDGGNQWNWREFGSLPLPKTASSSGLTAINSQRANNAVIFGDSFTIALEPFLGYHFGKCVYFRHEFVSKDIDQIKPVVVMDVMIERYLR
jgi:hypothetical protein